MTKEIKMWVAANITYSGSTYNSKVLVEYEHTGEMYFKKANHYTQDKDIAEEWKAKGKKVITKPGYYFIKRLAIPTIMANGQKGIWYINNSGDNYTINKVSKYWKKMHDQLSNNILTIN